MVQHGWEDWDDETRERMAKDLLLHGSARARLVADGLGIYVGPYTLLDIAENRRARDLPVEIHVVGDFEHTPPRGLDTARRVAEHLTDEGGTVREPGDDLEDGDVAWVRIDEPPKVSYEERMQLEKLSNLARVMELAGIVVFTPEVGRRYDTHLDARVWATSGDVDRVQRLEFNPYDKDTIAVELDGVGW